MAKSQCTPEQFVKAWQEADTVQDVANSLGMSYASIISRSRNYIAKGINLKLMTKDRNVVDVDKLNELCK